MEKESRETLIKIIITSVILAVVLVADKLTDLPEWADLLMYLVPYIIIGYETIGEAIGGILRGEFLGEEFLMFVATLGAMVIGFLPGAESEYAEAVFVMLFFAVGELLEGIAEGSSRKSVSALMEIRPDKALLLKDGRTVSVSPEDIHVGDVIVVSPGERIPLDGVIAEGVTSLNTVSLTGESVPKDVSAGDTVVSGCVNLTAVIKLRVTKEYRDSTVSRILDLVENAAENKSSDEKLVTRFARVYTPAVVAAALLLAFVPPLLSGSFTANFALWLGRALTFLVVSCPCALVISVPLAFFGGIGGASSHGILIKGSNHLETLTKLGTVVFDKTGTLTKGVFRVTAVHPEKYDGETLLHLASHVEKFSTHPIAVSLCEAYKEGDDDCRVGTMREFPGEGASASVNGHDIYVGNTKLMERVGAKWHDCGHEGTVVHISDGAEYLGHIVVSDVIKEDSAKAITSLKALGVKKCVLLTGDNENTASFTASALGIDEYRASLLPADKAAYLREYIASSKTAFVGDGINDAPSLALSDVGIAMGALGSDAAIEAADVVIMDDKPSKIPFAVSVAKRTVAIAKQNIIFALSVKFAVLFLASFGLAPMWLAVFADVGVTFLTVLNSIRAMKIKTGE